MNKYILHSLVVTLLLLASCDTSRKAVSHHSRQPKFIDDIYIGGHNKNAATADAIDRNAKPVAKKYSEKRYFPATVAKSGSADVEPKAISMDQPRIHSGRGESRELRDKYAGLLGIEKGDISNFSLYSFIDDWYGTSYHLGGQDKSGIDCSGFAKKLYESVFSTEIAHSSVELFSTCKRVKKAGDIEEGDLVFFKTHGKRISHVGVYLANDYFVHASTSQGVVISNLKDEYWHRRYAGAGKASKG